MLKEYSSKVWKTKIKLGDVLLLSLLGLIVIFSWPRSIASRQEDLWMLIRQGEEEYLYSRLETDRDISLYDGAGVEVMKVMIKDSKIWVEESDCSLQYCVLRGAIQEEGEWIICLPNKVFIVIQRPGAETAGPLSGDVDAEVF